VAIRGAFTAHTQREPSMEMDADAAQAAIAGDFPASAASVPVARHWACRWARQVGLADVLVERLSVNVTELVANAVVHARSPFRVSLSLMGSGVRIEVTDASEELPRPVHAAPDALSGRGLAIVRALSASAGVTHIPEQGKRVWSEVEP